MQLSTFLVFTFSSTSGDSVAIWSYILSVVLPPAALLSSPSTACPPTLFDTVQLSSTKIRPAVASSCFLPTDFPAENVGWLFSCNLVFFGGGCCNKIRLLLQI